MAPSPPSTPVQQMTLAAFAKASLPNVLAGIMTPVGGLVSTIFLGHLASPVPLAGVGLSTVVIECIYYSLIFLRLSTLSFAGEALARGANIPSASAVLVLYRGLVLASLAGFVLTATAYWFGHTVFPYFSADPAVELAAANYYVARLMGAIAYMTLMVIFGWLVGIDRAKDAFKLIALLGVLDVFFSWLLVIVFPYQEIGAGMAAMVAEWLTLLAAALGLARLFRRLGLNWTQPWANILNWHEFKRFFLLSRDLFARTIFLISMFVVFINASALFGVAFMAGTTIWIRLLDLVAFFIEGFAVTVQGKVAYYWARHENYQVMHIVRLGILCAVISLVGAIVIGGTTWHHWVPWMTSLPDVRAVLEANIILLALVLVFSSIAYIFDGFFAGVHRADYLRNAMLLATLSFVPIMVGVYHLHSQSLFWSSIVVYMAVRVGYLFYAAYRMEGFSLLAGISYLTKS